MAWADNDFPDANDPADVGWLLSYWRIVPCDSGCTGDYRLESRQFDHAATEEEALRKLDYYVAQKRGSGAVAGRKGLTLFLTKVVKMVPISDRTGEIVPHGN